MILIQGQRCVDQSAKTFSELCGFGRFIGPACLWSEVIEGSADDPVKETRPKRPSELSNP